MAAAVDVAVLTQDVENMKTVLNSKIGANDDIMVSVTDQLGSLTRKLDEFYAMLKENDNSIKTVISDNATVVNNNAAEVADLKVRIGAKVGESDSVLVGLQAALGAQQAETAMLKSSLLNSDQVAAPRVEAQEGSSLYWTSSHCQALRNSRMEQGS